MNAAVKRSAGEGRSGETWDGHVVLVAGGAVGVRAVDGERSARRATSCLIAPVLGDRVLCATLSDGTSFVLAVLERTEADARLELSLDRDAVLSVAEGRLDIVADHGIGVATQQTIQVGAESVELRARSATAVVDELFTIGKRALAHFARSTTVGEVVETVAETLSQKAKRALRFASEIDQVRAGFADYAAEKAMRLHGDNAFMTAEKVVKLDGENIHLG